MARVRRINVSQVEGDYSNDSDKRPNGEMGLYEDGNGGFDLVIHDGVNGTVDNKVLGKGKLYGHNEDSGDGSGFDTIKLIPDIGLYDSGSHQYIIVDPTAPNHIHLRPGGDPDSSNSDIFLGAENTNVKVSDQYDTVSINSGGNSQWLFSSDNTLSLPGGGLIDGSDSNVEVRGMNNFNVEASSNFNIVTNSQDVTNYQWIFKDDGNLQFPNNTLQSTAWTGGRVVEAPQSSIGSVGDLEGDLAFNTSYLYYCTENYEGTQYQVVHGASSSADGVNSGYLVFDNYQLPQVGWQVNYGGNSAIIDQVNTSTPGLYIVFVSTTLVIPGNATFSWGPLPSTNIWKRIGWSNDTW